MYLLTCDLINSKQNNLKMVDAFDQQILRNLSLRFNLKAEHIEISGGDQLRVLFTDPQITIELIIYILMILAENQMRARCYLSAGQAIEMEGLTISTATGQLFYDNKQLETEVDKRQVQNYIYYSSDKSNNLELVKLLFTSFSELVLLKEEYLATLYMYIYEHKTQAEISSKIGKSQSTVNNQLIKVKYKLFKQFEAEIIKLLIRS